VHFHNKNATAKNKKTPVFTGVLQVLGAGQKTPYFGTFPTYRKTSTNP